MRVIVWVCFFLIVANTYGQSCDCPATATCNTCMGGITTLTLRFNGSTAQTITAADQQGTVFSQIVNANATFSFVGSLPNDKFVGATVDLSVAGIANAAIPSNCGSVAVGNVYGSFTIISATSKNGGPLCCSGALVENTPPQITGCPANVTINLPPSSCKVAGGWTPPTASDNCTLASFTSTHAPTDLLNVGTTTVVYTAVDSYNNSSSCSFTVTVVDTTKPVFTNCLNTLIVDAGASCQAVVSWTLPAFTDNCSATLSSSHSPGNSFPIGTTPVTHTATDPSGNSSTCSFDIIVRDTSPPVINGCPGNITLSINSCESAVTWTPPAATDNCPATMQASHVPGSIFEIGTTKVTYTATNSAGLTTTCSFNIILNTTSTPTITGCPGDITLHTFNDAVEASWIPPQATPFCGEVTSIASHQPGTLFNAGITDVEYEFTDATNNKSSCSFKVTVIKDEITFEASKAVTPNGDGVNDSWQIGNIEKFKDNTVLVVDRWGNKIYQSDSYDNAAVLWTGIGPSGNKVPMGTYFYTIEVRVNGSLVRDSGFIEVLY